MVENQNNNPPIENGENTNVPNNDNKGKIGDFEYNKKETYGNADLEANLTQMSEMYGNKLNKVQEQLKDYKVNEALNNIPQENRETIKALLNNVPNDKLDDAIKNISNGKQGYKEPTPFTKLNEKEYKEQKAQELLWDKQVENNIKKNTVIKEEVERMNNFYDDNSISANEFARLQAKYNSDGTLR